MGPRHPPHLHRDAWSDLWTAWWRDPAPRAERGVIRFLILDAISTEARHGYEIIHAIAAKSGGVYRPSAGAIYPTLQLLEDLGLAHAAQQDERKVYSITESGKQELQAHAEEVSEFYQGSSDVAWESHPEVVMHVMKRIGMLVRLFKKGVRRGTVRPTTMRQLRTILDQAIDELEELLASERP
jgi:DNA-binding PadR family transcriptional regulator